jgi:hypothetical protein
MLAGLLAATSAARGAGDLATSFQSPPASARMWTWWFWLGDRVDEKSITADLEALKAQGMAGVTVYSISGPGIPGKGPDYMSPPWRALFRHTVKEADRLGLGVSAILCSGWNAGGPWITPEQACKRQVSSELTLTGPQHFTDKLPQPAGDPRFYQDLAVQAFPNNPAKPRPAITAGSSHKNYPVANANDDNTASMWVSNGENPDEGPSKTKPEWLRLDLDSPRLVKHLTILPRPGFGPRAAEVQTSTDGTTFTTVESLAMGPDQPTVVRLPGTPIRAIRLWITATHSPRNENVQIVELSLDDTPGRRAERQAQLAIKTVADSFGDAVGTPIQEVCAAPLKPLLPTEPGSSIPMRSVINLSAQCKADGTLDWQVPPGQWTVLRTGFTMTGSTTNWSSPTGVGLEADPLDPAAMDAQFAKAAAPLIEEAGNLTGKVFRSVQIDSWENKLPSWSAGFRDDFKKFRGYDPLPYLPALAGRELVSAALTDRFLYDYRKTVGDCVAEHYFGRLSQLAEAKGLIQQSEAGGVCVPKVMALDCLKNLGRCAIPMGEFWQDGLWVEANQNKNGKQTASAAHLYGKPIVAAEAFTSFQHWVDSPASLKPTADRAFCEGFNHFFIFSSATHSDDGMPGTEFCAGTFFNRKITWWNQAHCFSDYVARCSHLLQQGRFAADVLFYNGDGVPNMVAPKHIDPSLGPGYDYDVCNSEILLTRLTVKDGRIVLPDGMSYRLLVLPESATMPVPVLAKIKDLVAAGMTVVGPKPERAPGLTDYPQCDEQVKSIAANLWGGCNGTSVQQHTLGKGQVIWGRSVRDVLGSLNVSPDFSHAGAAPDAFLDWIHRSSNGTEIYFVANRRDRPEKASCTFRVRGKQPELWDPVTGLQRDALAFNQGEGGTTVALEFPAYGSQFIVFRRAIAAEAAGTAKTNTPTLTPVLELTGPWTVKFDPQWGGPESITFPELVDWTKRPEDAIRFYSGKATYHKSFDVPATALAGKNILRLDLGDLNHLAEVRLNGKPLGILWTKPYQAACSNAIKAGSNALEIDVINLWPNRLLGDAKLPSEKRLTQTNITTYSNGDRQPLPSGLLGPVRLMTAEPP